MRSTPAVRDSSLEAELGFPPRNTNAGLELDDVGAAGIGRRAFNKVAACAAVRTMGSAAALAFSELKATRLGSTSAECASAGVWGLAV